MANNIMSKCLCPINDINNNNNNNNNNNINNNIIIIQYNIMSIYNIANNV